MTKSGNYSTTVAMDYGIMNLADGEKIHLYGTPGQERFDFMWSLINGGGGLVQLLDNTWVDRIKDMKFFLDSFGKFITETSVSIVVAQVDLSNNLTIAEYHAQLQDSDFKSR